MSFQTKNTVIYGVGGHIDHSYRTLDRRGITTRSIIRFVLAVWFVVVFLLGAAGAFARLPGTPPVPILIGAAVPLIVFFVAYRSSATFREFVLAADLSLLTAIQSWRAGGLGFLALYAHGILPGVFAWPAGLGDILIGVTAPWIAMELVHRPAFVNSRIFAAWNLLGILDLVVAVSIGALSSALASPGAPEVTTGPMAELPLVLIPAYLVPLFIIFHLTALFRAHQTAQTGGGPDKPEQKTQSKGIWPCVHCVLQQQL